MMFLYTVFGWLVYIVIYPYGRLKAAAGDPLWRGRLAIWKDVSPQDLWFHAASVGEVKIIGFLVDYLLEKKPDINILLTVMTRTGYKTAVATTGRKATVAFFPIDTLPLIRRTLDLIQPGMIVIAETEIWPVLINEASKRKIPMVLINGRMSDRAFKRYKLLKKSLGRLLGRYERYFFKTVDDRRKYLYFGIDENRTVTAGDMKFDAPLPDRAETKIIRTREKIGLKRENFMLVAGSTRSGEEALLADIYRKLKPKYDRLAFVLAPRHLDRIEEIKALLEKAGVSYNIFDGEKLTGSGIPSENHKKESFILIDRMGLLNELYLAADLAFVGGTMVSLGGHNLLEPVWAGTPVVYGPSLDNVYEAAEYIEARQYGDRVNNKEELEKIIEEALLGRLSFAVKTEADLQKSATTQIGRYILERTGHV
jgi:tRNA (guanine-N7-)-methyltransferase